MRTKGNATPIIPMPFLKKRYDRTRGSEPGVVTNAQFLTLRKKRRTGLSVVDEELSNSFLRFLGRSERFSSHTCATSVYRWICDSQIDVLILTFSLMDLLTGSVIFILNDCVYSSIRFVGWLELAIMVYMLCHDEKLVPFNDVSQIKFHLSQE